jgi:hypothetical protein
LNSPLFTIIYRFYNKFKRKYNFLKKNGARHQIWREEGDREERGVKREE